MRSNLALAEHWTDDVFDTFETSRSDAPEREPVPPAPAEPVAWLRKLFPRYVTAPFAERHLEYWRWVWAIELGKSADPFVAVWPRGGAKSTSAELAAAALGCRGQRRYVLYVRQTQEKADDSVSNVATLLEGDAVETYYPQHADRLLGKYGNVRAWRRNRLRTAGGLVVDALGLDVAARGAKVDEQRPDLIILDDIDDKLDTLGTTEKKIAVITTSILPAGSKDSVVLAIQNLIIPEGFFTRMVDGRADYLARRIVSGPHPAIEGAKYEKVLHPRSGATRHVIVDGRATWEGQNLETCQKQVDEWGYSAFRKEAQHEVRERAEGLVLRTGHEHYESLSDERCRELVKLGQVFGGNDFGAWRFGFILRAVDKDGIPHEIAEYFAQKGADQNHDTHARAINAILIHYGVKRLRWWGDAANPSDITELNRAFKRIGAVWRVVAVAQENKIRRASVERLNDMLDRNALRYRRDVHLAVANILAAEFNKPAADFLTWQHGYNAASSGTPMQGARLHWELDHWSYPIPQPGKAQEQDPDDHTADGADLIAADRYGVMSWWRPGKEEEQEERSAFDPDVLKQDAERSRRYTHRAARRKSYRPIEDY